jgi:hypothetical protein
MRSWLYVNEMNADSDNSVPLYRWLAFDYSNIYVRFYSHLGSYTRRVCRKVGSFIFNLGNRTEVTILNIKKK